MANNIRKNILLSEEHVSILERISKENSDWSDSEIIRRALECYRPDDDEENKLLDMLLDKLQAQNKRTEKSRRDAGKAMKEAKEYFDSVKHEYESSKF